MMPESPTSQESAVAGGDLPWVDSGAAGGRNPATGLDDGGEGARSLVRMIDEWVRGSPPFTVSLSLHVIVLLALALWVVRVQRPRHVVLDLAFATTTPDSERPGVEVAPTAIPTPASEPDPVALETPDPVVPDPAAAPDENESEPPRTDGHAAPSAPSVGALLDGRSAGRRAALVAAFGGSSETEAAVSESLRWLAKCQGKDGLWSLVGRYSDAARQENRLAATAMALLAFQGAGQTPTEGVHAPVVAKAWQALAERQLANGQFDVPPSVPEQHLMYAHAQATIAICELAGMTADPEWRSLAQRAVDFAVASQALDGGWRYAPGASRGDMSLTGWFMMALKSGQMARLDVPADTFGRVEAFLESLAFENGSRYGYYRYSGKSPLDDTSAVSAEGLLSRQFLGWRRDDPRLAAGVGRLLSINLPLLESWGAGESKVERKDVNGWYYITQVVHHRGGEDWERWNAVMREVLPRAQVKKGRDAGSWDPALDLWGHAGGRLFVTCFCTYMLEVYYRHLPLYGEEALAAAPAP